MPIPKGFEIVSPNTPAGFEVVSVQADPTQIPIEAGDTTIAPTTQQQTIGGAIAEPFQNSEFGLQPETVAKFTSSPIEALNQFNRIVLEQGVSPALAVLEGIGAASEAGIAGITETAIKSGVDETQARKFERDANSALMIGGLVSGVATPLGLGKVSRSVPKAPKARALGETQQRLDEVENLGPQGAVKRQEAVDAQAGAVIQQEAQALPVEVPLSQANVTQGLNDQRFFDEAVKGLHGPDAQARANAFQETQNRALRSNVEEIQKQASGRATAATAEEAGLGVGQAQEALKQTAKADKAAIRTAYESADELDASIDGELLARFGEAQRAKLDESFDINNMPLVQDTLDDLGAIVKGEKLTPKTIKQIERQRRIISSRIGSSQISDPSQAAALQTIKRDLDTHMSDLLDEGLVNGNTEAINAYKTARDLRAKFGREFQANKVVEKIVTQDLTQEEAVNLLFGGSQMGFKTNAGSSVAKIKSILGPDSAAFKALKEESILRLVKNQAGQEVFSGAKFNTALNKMLSGNQELVRQLFSKAEIEQLKKFGRVSKAVTEKKAGAINRSNNASAIVGFLRNSGLTNNFATKLAGMVLSPITSTVGKAVGESRAARKITKQTQPTKTPDVNTQIEAMRGDPELFKRAIAGGLGVKDNGE